MIDLWQPIVEVVVEVEDLITLQSQLLVCMEWGGEIRLLILDAE